MCLVDWAILTALPTFCIYSSTILTFEFYRVGRSVYELGSSKIETEIEVLNFVNFQNFLDYERKKYRYCTRQRQKKLTQPPKLITSTNMYKSYLIQATLLISTESCVSAALFVKRARHIKSAVGTRYVYHAKGRALNWMHARVRAFSRANDCASYAGVRTRRAPRAYTCALCAFIYLLAMVGCARPPPTLQYMRYCNVCANRLVPSLRGP